MSADAQSTETRRDNGPAISRINAVQRVATDLYWEKDEDGENRDLEAFEALFISAVNSIITGYDKVRADGFRTWGDGNAYGALCALAYREEADAMEAALASYKAEQERRYNDELEGVAFQMAAE